MAQQSKASVSSHLLAGSGDSNHATSTDVLWCVLRHRSLQWADHPSREVLLTMVYHCVLSRNLKNEVALAHIGLLCQWKGYITNLSKIKRQQLKF